MLLARFPGSQQNFEQYSRIGESVSSLNSFLLSRHFYQRLLKSDILGTGDRQPGNQMKLQANCVDIVILLRENFLDAIFILNV